MHHRGSVSSVGKRMKDKDIKPDKPRQHSARHDKQDKNNTTKNLGNGIMKKTMWYFLKHLFFGITLTLNPKFLGSEMGSNIQGNGIIVSRISRKWDHLYLGNGIISRQISRKWDR